MIITNKRRPRKVPQGTPSIRMLCTLSHDTKCKYKLTKYYMQKKNLENKYVQDKNETKDNVYCESLTNNSFINIYSKSLLTNYA